MSSAKRYLLSQSNSQLHSVHLLGSSGCDQYFKPRLRCAAAGQGYNLNRIRQWADEFGEALFAEPKQFTTKGGFNVARGGCDQYFKPRLRWTAAGQGCILKFSNTF